MNESVLTNKFSWHRVGMVARFYSPCLRLPLILYPAVGLVLGLMAFWLSKTEIGFLFTGLLSMAMSLMFYFFPLFFTKLSSPVVESSLPATVGERLTLILLACLVVNPIITFLPYYIIDWTIVTKPEIMEELSELGGEFFTKTYGLAAMQSLPPLVTCMFIVFTRWKNRISAAIGFTILAMFALSVIGGIIGVVIAVTDLIPLVQNDPSSYEAGVEFGKTLANKMLPVIYIIGAICIAYTVLMVYLLYRKMLKQQL